jgi:hypothetical protein
VLPLVLYYSLKNKIEMTNEILTSENLIEIHKNLNDFAKHHQNLGGQKAHKLIKAMWDETKSQPRDGSKDALLRDEGFDKAFSIILKELHRQFVP